MRKILPLIILFLGVATWCVAGPNDDPKYLKGAVPEVDGKVVFERQININQTVSSKHLFELVKSWSDTTFVPNKEASSQRVLLIDPDQHLIAVQVEETLLFKTNFISVDRATLVYRLIMKIEDGKILMTFSNFKYEYQDFKDAEKAENLITDKVAYNEKKNTLNRYYDKFRIFTIDEIDGQVNDLKKYLGKVSVDRLDKDNAEKLLQKQQELSVIKEDKNTISIVKEETPNPVVATVPTVPVVSVLETREVETTPKATPVVAPVTSSSQTLFDGYKQIKDANVMANYQSMIAQSKLILVNDKGESLLASWNGLNDTSDQKVSMVTIAKNKTKDVTDTYTLSFINNSIYRDELNRIEKDGSNASLTLKDNAYSESWMIIVCKKMMTIPATSNQDSSITWDKLSKEDKVLLMGNIEQIWVR